MHFETLLKQIIESDDEKRFKKAMALALDKMRSVMGFELTKEFIETWYDFALEDVERKKTTMFEICVATFKYSKYIKGYPCYAEVWQVIRTIREEQPRVPESHRLEESNPLRPEERKVQAAEIKRMMKELSDRLGRKGVSDVSGNK